MAGFLSRPYPINDTSAYKFQAAIVPSVLLFILLYYFRPFGLHRFPNSTLAGICAGYAGVTLAVELLMLFVVPAVFKRIFNESKWTILREILFVLLIIFCIGTANAYYSIYLFSDTFGMNHFLYFQLLTVLAAVIPVTIVVLLKQIYLTRMHRKMAEELSNEMHHKRRLQSNPEQQVTLHSTVKKEELTLPAVALLYIRGSGSYIEVHYVSDGRAVMKRLRSSLKHAREDLRHLTAFYRCHRGWIVNLDQVVSVTGNSQGYQLVLKDSTTVIPVSRNLNDDVKTRLSK